MTTTPQAAQVLTKLIAEHLTSTYACTRVWSAWQVGTMSEDDFVPLSETDFAHDLAKDILANLQASTPVEPLIVKGALSGMVDAQVKGLWPTRSATPAEPAQVPCEACGGQATHEAGSERTSFPGAYCDDCDPPTVQPAQAADHDALRAAQTGQGEAVAWRDHVEQRLHSWRQSFVNRSGDQLALDDFMDADSLDDLIDYVLDEWVDPPAAPALVGARSPGHQTVAVYDLGPANNPDSAIAAKLIEMGWTPPKVATAQAEPVQAGELPDEREAFEQWASDNGEFPRAVARSGDVYHLMATQTYWLAWQARAVLSARKPFTNAQIERLFYNSNRGNGCASLAAFVRVVRLVESAHGIGLEVKP